MESQTITRVALGRIAGLGDLYDARRDNFCGISVFTNELPDEAISSTDSPFSDIHFVHSDNFSEKFHKLGVAAELQVSVLAGLLKLEGSARYLNDKKQSARTVKSSLIYNIKTKKDQLNIYHDGLKDLFSLDAIETGMATHIVTGISWGADSVLSCTHKNEENREIKEIEGKLSAHFQKASFAISGNAEIDVGEEDNFIGESLEVRIFGDILPKNEDLPTTFKEALLLMKQVPSLVESYNDGKGKPLAYQMVPISLLKNYLSFEIQGDGVLNTLAEASLVRVVQLFDQTARTQQQLNDFYQDAVDFLACVSAEELDRITSIKESMTTLEANLRSTLSSILADIRCGKEEVSKLEEIIAEFHSEEFSPLNVSTLLNNWTSLSKKIKFAKLLRAEGVKYIGRDGSLDEQLLEDFESKTIVFLFTAESRTTDSGIWKGNREIFFKKLKKNVDGHRFIAVDCDFHPGLLPESKRSCIQIYQEGSVVTVDLLEEHAKLANVNWAQSTTKTERLERLPRKLVSLFIQCSGSKCDPEKKYHWDCRKCGRHIEYGFDHHVYCKCGKTLATKMEFRCSHPEHGMNFELHEEDFLLALLDELRPFPEVNILILGETGVGKSTWINSFINFLTYQSLEEAEAGDLCTLIPSQFTMYNENFEQVMVRTGEDKNEFFQPGQSATQQAKVYPFVIGNTTIRLIDTPGIGDTRGIEQDKKNFQNILGTLAYLDEIHGICILLKPNESRLDVMFRFCIKELLTYLHRDASQNIVFCFTNSRGTSYRPAGTMTSLIALLKENKDVEIVISPATTYYFDSEAYRYLAATKNDPPVNFDEFERSNFSISWNKSMDETNRLLKFISSQKPHPIKSTLNLNTARELVLSLTRPLAEIASNIQTIKKIQMRELETLRSTKAKIEDLEKFRFVSQPVLRRRAIDHPKTVCANKNCAKIRSTEGYDYHLTEYVQICHQRCYVQGVSEDTIGQAGLLKCDAMSGNTCRFCSHSYTDHLHVLYDSYKEIVQVENKTITDILKDDLDDKKKKEELIHAKEEEIQKLEDEQKKIEQATAKFACFLKLNAITAYNDGMEAYLNVLIKQEKGLGLKDNPNLERLEESLKSYLEEKRILENAMEQGQGVEEITPEGIQQLVAELKGLKAGESLDEALNYAENSRNAIYQEIVSNREVIRDQNGKSGLSKLFDNFLNWFA